MNHDARVRQAVAFSVFAGSQKKGSHGCCKANAIRVNRRRNILIDRGVSNYLEHIRNGANIPASEWNSSA